MKILYSITLILMTLCSFYTPNITLGQKSDSTRFYAIAKSELLYDVQLNGRVCKSVKRKGYTKLSDSYSYVVFSCIVNDFSKDYKSDFVITINHTNPSYPFVSRIQEKKHEKNPKKEFFRI